MDINNERRQRQKSMTNDSSNVQEGQVERKEHLPEPQCRLINVLGGPTRVVGLRHNNVHIVHQLQIAESAGLIRFSLKVLQKLFFTFKSFRAKQSHPISLRTKQSPFSRFPFSTRKSLCQNSASPYRYSNVIESLQKPFSLFNSPWVDGTLSESGLRLIHLVTCLEADRRSLRCLSRFISQWLIVTKAWCALFRFISDEPSCTVNSEGRQKFAQSILRAIQIITR